MAMVCPTFDGGYRCIYPSRRFSPPTSTYLLLVGTFEHGLGVLFDLFYQLPPHVLLLFGLGVMEALLQVLALLIGSRDLCFVWYHVTDRVRMRVQGRRSRTRARGQCQAPG